MSDLFIYTIEIAWERHLLLLDNETNDNNNNSDEQTVDDGFSNIVNPSENQQQPIESNNGGDDEHGNELAEHAPLLSNHLAQPNTTAIALYTSHHHHQQQQQQSVEPLLLNGLGGVWGAGSFPLSISTTNGNAMNPEFPPCIECVNTNGNNSPNRSPSIPMTCNHGINRLHAVTKGRYEWLQRTIEGPLQRLDFGGRGGGPVHSSRQREQEAC